MITRKKLRKSMVWLCLILILLLLQGCKKEEQKAKEIHVSVAASLKESMTEITKTYEESHPNQKISLDFGGSGAIREKVLSGAPIDGVFLASQKDIDALVDAKALDDPKEVLTNQLFVVGSSESKKTSDNLSEIVGSAEKIAIGEPNTVPAGKYAVETLKSLDIYQQAEAKLVQANDVRQVLSYVESGNATIGFVYQTDAQITTKVTILDVVDQDLHAPIIYGTGIVSESKNKEEMTQFNDFLSTDKAKQVFEKYGFTLSK